MALLDWGRQKQALDEIARVLRPAPELSRLWTPY